VLPKAKSTKRGTGDGAFERTLSSQLRALPAIQARGPPHKIATRRRRRRRRRRRFSRAHKKGGRSATVCYFAKRFGRRVQ
jgi:hypothetical protein